MKRLFLISLVAVLGLAFVIPISSSWSAGSGSVISPNGGESWKTGTTKTIIWSTGNAGTYAQIYLYKSGAYYADLTPYPEYDGGKTWNDGKFLWTIPRWLVASSEYKVRIISSSDDGINDYSDSNFTITKPASPIRVTIPNGGQKWKTGKKYVIKWAKGNGGSFVRIQLLKSDKHYKWVSKKTKNDGKHPWKVPATVASGSAYKIKITSVKNKKVFDKSNQNFTITKTSSISVTKPNGGEKWVAGKKYTIKWDKDSAGTHVKIHLLKSGKHYLWVSKKTKNDGKYTWTIPTSVATGSAYKIRIISTSNATAKDRSNSNFTVTNSY